MRLDNVLEKQETSPSVINVLIIHNDKKLFRLVKDYLEAMRYDVDVVYTGLRKSHFSHKQFFFGAFYRRELIPWSTTNVTMDIREIKVHFHFLSYI